MGNSFRKMFDKLFGNREMRVVMLVSIISWLWRIAKPWKYAGGYKL